MAVKNEVNINLIAETKKCGVQMLCDHKNNHKMNRGSLLYNLLKWQQQWARITGATKGMIVWKIWY